MNGKHGVPPRASGSGCYRVRFASVLRTILRLPSASLTQLGVKDGLEFTPLNSGASIPHTGFPNYQIMANFKTVPIYFF